MSNILKKLEADTIEEIKIDIDEFTKKYASELNNSGLLKKESPTYKTEGTFECKQWILYNNNTFGYSYLDFSKIDDMVKLNIIDDDDYKIIKCWLSDRLLEEGKVGTSIAHKSRRFLDLFLESQGLKLELIETKKGNLISSYIDEIESTHSKGELIESCRSFIDFIERVGYNLDSFNAIVKVISKYKNTSSKSNSRELPCTSSIFDFDLCIKYFFYEDNEPIIKKIYYPILIWWKVTNIIPMRPSELICQTTRDCLVKENNKYYLKVNRVKVQRTKSTARRGRIPILNKLEISKEVYDLINRYIEFTDFTESHTLFSWNAMSSFKEEYMNHKTNDLYKELLPNFYGFRKQKFNPMAFGTHDFDALLEHFYTHIVEGLYGYKIEDSERLTAGDTRHLAFSSLLLQGLSPIEIAMLGGHTTLEMQDSYTHHVQYYINNEILNFISDKTLSGEESKMFNTLKEIISKKPYGYKLGVNLSDFEKTDDGIGYCLLNTFDIDEICDDVPCCPFCTKWWCEPTNESYIAVRKYILNSHTAPLQVEIEREEEFFINLINNAKILNINGLSELEKSTDEELKSQALKIRAKADKLAHLKAALVERDFEKSTFENTIKIRQ